MFKGIRNFFREVAELSRDEQLGARIYKDYTYDGLENMVRSEYFPLIKPVFRTLELVPRTISGMVKGRKVERATAAASYVSDIHSALREFTSAGAGYLHTPPESMLKRQMSLESTLSQLPRMWRSLSGSAHRALRDFGRKVIHLEHGAVFDARPEQGDESDDEWRRRWFVSRSHLGRDPGYPPGFEEAKALSSHAWEHGTGTPTESNKQLKALWDEIHHLHEALPTLENYWASLEDRGPELAHKIQQRLNSE